jgi:hypothetical protein
MPTTDADELALAAERATIGGLMLDADAASTARGIVNADAYALRALRHWRRGEAMP